MKDERIKDIKFIIIFIAIVSVAFVYLGQTSLAKYRKQTSAEINVNIAEWNIIVNNETINNKTVLTQAIVPSFTGNEYTKDSVIAPGSIGYCDIVINASKVDVDFIYELSTNIPQESSIPDLKITGYIINPTATNTTEIPYDESTPITGEIKKNSGNNTIRIYIKWEEENGTMNNQQDTAVAIDSDSKALISANLKFHQKTN